MMRWSTYFQTVGDEAFRSLWAELTSDRLLVVLGAGFDPRLTRAISLLGAVAQTPVDVLRVGLSEGASDHAMSNMAKRHREYVNELVTDMGGDIIELPFPLVHARRSAGVLVSRTFHQQHYLDRYNQVLVDISGLPRSIYFPLIRGLLEAEAAGWDGDLHVVAVNSHEVDRALLQEGAESAAPLGGFAGPSDEAGWAATVWVPVLGEGIGEQLVTLHDAIEPDEVIPVLPFPAAHLRRGDDLLLEHRELLSGRFEVEPRNYLYASEWNPFDLYRAITDLYARYQPSLRPLGAAKFVLSTHSSKLLSIGVLLAAYEIGIQVMHVASSRHGLVASADTERLANHGTVSDLWLMGEPYR